ncbi:MAG: phosphatidylglycerol lysyltransferase domain-containing protein [Chitinispirillales bacterium]|nr:phosphatidylglycerol lysyltransferase domain-containing protein [Chitinispirillales bacterium]
MPKSNIPVFPDFIPLTIDDKKFLDHILKSDNPVTSELSFTNLFIWREFYRISWSTLNGFVIFTGFFSGSDLGALVPVGRGDRVPAALRLLSFLKTLGSERASIERADSKFLSEIEGDSRFSVEPQPEHFDYLYPLKNFYPMSGRKLHGKRNHVSQFLRKQTAGYEPVSKSNLDNCLEFLNRWYKREYRGEAALYSEHKSVTEILKNLEYFNCRAAALTINEKVEALTLGELLNNDTAVIHVEKANHDIHNLYTYIASRFCAEEFGNVKFINREQDLGKENLKKAKMSWYPCMLVKKFRITRK